MLLTDDVLRLVPVTSLLPAVLYGATDEPVRLPFAELTLPVLFSVLPLTEFVMPPALPVDCPLRAP